MPGQAVSAIFAIGLGLVVGFVLFVPFVAISYRRRGRLGVGRFLAWASALVYFWAIWTYTLLPLPSSREVQCVGVELDPLTLVRALRDALSHGSAFLIDPAFLQIALNVALFIPLGFFLRVLGGRGILIALLGGFVVSLAIETTQLTGVWGIYSCAYRVFDVGDLITNTSGSVIGSILALAVPRRLHGLSIAADAHLPRPVTRGRRMLALLCDGIGFFLASTVMSVLITAVRLFLLRDVTAAADDDIAVFGGTLATSAIWLVVILATGRSPGDSTVRLQYRGGRLSRPIARLLRWLGGIAGISALGLLWGPLTAILVFVSLFMVVTTRGGRGLPGLISGQELTDSRASATASTRS